MREKVNELTRMLCEVLPSVRISDFSPELAAWWNAHQEADRLRREEEERTRQNERRATEARLLSKIVSLSEELEKLRKGEP